MDLILSLEKDALNQMRTELIRLNRISHRSCHGYLHQVQFDDFCSVMLHHIAKRDNSLNLTQLSEDYLRSIEFVVLMRSLITYFEAVDIDSRGVISFTDFTNFCLRIGRIRFKPSIKRSLANFAQNVLTKMPFLPVTKLCYIPFCKTIYGFDGDSPIVRMYR